MAYDYKTQRAEIFTETGQVTFLKVRDRAHHLLKEAGAFRLSEVLRGVTGDSWTQMACVDRLVELGEVVELTRDNGCWGQYRVFTTPQTHNR
jgi:hypothetical protein